ncbi:hypothetical protein JCM19039_3458 [Geomicrobium sp. JCM 19039]|nr:hypothetical protein JCM19039_3458 [Geomicrobium sp. JCM 19039]
MSADEKLQAVFLAIVVCMMTTTLAKAEEDVYESVITHMLKNCLAWVSSTMIC